MATIKIIPHEKTYLDASTEMRVDIYGTQSGKRFKFELNENKIKVYELGTTKGAKSRSTNWFKYLSANERADVYQSFLAYQRSKAVTEGGVQVAALGVYPNGDIYIGENSDVLVANGQQRQCGEVMMNAIAGRRDRDKQLNALKRSGRNANEYQPRKFVEVATMGGKKEGDYAPPCGHCCDLLYEHMEPGAEVWAFPISKPTAKLQLKADVESPDELEAGQIWRTSIDHLNKKRDIFLNPADTELQREGMRKMAEGLALDLARFRKRYLETGENTPPQIEKYRPGYNESLSTSASPTGPAEPNPYKLNREFYNGVYTNVYDRLTSIIKEWPPEKEFEFTGESVLELIKAHIKFVRVAAIQMDNGEVYLGDTCKTFPKSGISTASPEIAAHAMTSHMWGNQGVFRYYATEMNPKDIGEVGVGSMRSSRKAVWGMLVKQTSKITDMIEGNYIPFNSGELTREKIENITNKMYANEAIPVGSWAIGLPCQRPRWRRFFPRTSMNLAKDTVTPPSPRANFPFTYQKPSL